TCRRSSTRWTRCLWSSRPGSWDGPSRRCSQSAPGSASSRLRLLRNGIVVSPWARLIVELREHSPRQAQLATRALVEATARDDTELLEKVHCALVKRVAALRKSPLTSGQPGSRIRL